MSKQLLKRVLRPVVWHATTQLPSVSPSVAAGVEADLSDKDPVIGVSYSAKRRLWRAYLHRGNKQVFHAWRETKSEAIAARREALERFGEKAMCLQDSRYSSFRRTVKAPGYRVLDRTLEHLAEEAAEVIHIKSKIIRFGLKDKFGGETGQRRLGCEIGNLLAMVELLVLDGAVLAQDIEDGMALKTESLKEGY